MPYQWTKSIRKTFFSQIRHLSSEPTISSTRSLPSKVDAVVCGGGVVGCSVSYHLANRGLKILLLEQGRLACGTSWHAAGLIGRFKHGPTFHLTSYGHQLYKWMEENGYPTGFKECGRLDIASTPDMVTELKRLADENRGKGLIVEELLPSEVQKKSPWVDIKNVEAGFWVPADATTSPTDVCVSLAKMAKDKGAEIFESCKVLKVHAKEKAVHFIETSLGDVECKNFILCGGLWSRQFAEKTEPKIHLPLQPMQHFYLVTKPIEGVDRMHPVLRDRNASMYAREWNGGFLVGVFETRALPVFQQGLPEKFEFQLLSENWEHFQPFYEPIMKRLPFLQTAEIRHMTNGPESFTPDCNPLIGEVPEVKGYYVATGMNSSGIMLAAGMGRTISELIVDGRSSLDMSSYDVKRFLPHESNRKFLQDRGTEALGAHYTIAYPKQGHFKTGRYLCSSPWQQQHKEVGAIFESVNGCEVPLCFMNDPGALEMSGSFSKPFWFHAVQKEQAIAKNGSAFCDLTGLLATCDLIVEDIGKAKELFNTNADVPLGKTIETLLVSKSEGTAVTQCSILRKDTQRFTLLYPLASFSYVQRWLNKNDDVISFVVDMTSSFTYATFLGRNVKQFLKKIEVEFPPKGSYTESELGYASNVLILNCPWLPAGNLTCCLPTQHAFSTYKLLREESIVPIGLHALDLLRIEQGLPWWNHEINTNTKVKKLNKAQEGTKGTVENSILHFVIKNCTSEAVVWPWGKELVFNQSKAVGAVTSVAFSYDLKQFIGLAVVQRDADKTEDIYQVKLAGTEYHLDVLNVL